MREEPRDLVVQHPVVGKVHQTDCTAANLVFISRANAATSGANFGITTGKLTRLIQRHMVLQDQGTSG